jgi:hypothetical protein
MKPSNAYPGLYSDELKAALGMTEGAPPPWLINMQRYGPPPSYPSLKIPGLNAPIPFGSEFGYHPGGWGKPPVDHEGNPLYGDVFGMLPQIEDDLDKTVCFSGRLGCSYCRPPACCTCAGGCVPDGQGRQEFCACVRMHSMSPPVGCANSYLCALPRSAICTLHSVRLVSHGVVIPGEVQVKQHHWGELEEDEEETSEEEAEEEEEEPDQQMTQDQLEQGIASGMVTGLASSLTEAGIGTEQTLDMRKTSGTSTSGPTPALYTVLEQQKARPTDGLSAVDHTYKIPSNARPANAAARKRCVSLACAFLVGLSFLSHVLPPSSELPERALMSSLARWGSQEHAHCMW